MLPGVTQHPQKIRRFINTRSNCDGPVRCVRCPLCAKSVQKHRSFFFIRAQFIRVFVSPGHLLGCFYAPVRAPSGAPNEDNFISI